MIITDRFVMLAFPKAGSSFVRRNLKKIHNFNTIPRRVLRKLGFEVSSSMTELLLPLISARVSRHERSRHALYIQVPEEHRHKALASCSRNPLDRYVSMYLFGRWKASYPLISDKVVRTFPAFPDLSFQEYYDMIHSFGSENRLQGLRPKVDLGIHTIQFVQFHFKDPLEVLRTLDDDYIQRRQYRNDMASIVFLQQESLNRDLYEFLLGCGYPDRRIRYLLEADRVNVTPRTSRERRRESFYTPDLVDRILDRDKLMFELFPQYKTGLG